MKNEHGYGPVTSMCIMGREVTKYAITVSVHQRL